MEQYGTHWHKKRLSEKHCYHRHLEQQLVMGPYETEHLLYIKGHSSRQGSSLENQEIFTKGLKKLDIKKANNSFKNWNTDPSREFPKEYIQIEKHLTKCLTFLSIM